MKKKDYFLQVFDNKKKLNNASTGKVLVRKEFYKLGEARAIYEATKYLNDNKELQGSYHSELKILLTSESRNRFKIYKMQWNSYGLSDGTGHFGEWISIKNRLENDKKNRCESKLSNATVILGIFIFMVLTYIYAFDLTTSTLSVRDSATVTTGLYITTLLILACNFLMKDRLHKMSIHTKDVIGSIIVLEVPFILVLICSLVVYSKVYGVPVLLVIVYSVVGILSMIIKSCYDYRAALKDFYGKKLRKE